MKTLIVGGNFGEESKASSIVRKLTEEMPNGTRCINGGSLDSLPSEINSDLILWMPNIVNEVPKQYPKKTVGNVLIVSKVMRDGYTELDAVSRIFKMHGNAVIAIYKEERFRFKLIDALGNTWYDDSDLSELVVKIKEFYQFTKNSVRVRTKQIYIDYFHKNNDVQDFINLNNTLAKYIQVSCGERFFGNLSTRCMLLFPSLKNDISILVSPRNVNKKNISEEDMVLCQKGDNILTYVGNKKPSVDSPVQLKIYENKSHINYIIHGHAFIKDAVETSEYFVCGDIREADEVIELIDDNQYGAINLKNHGFLLYSDTLDNLKELINGLEFFYERKPL